MSRTRPAQKAGLVFFHPLRLFAGCATIVIVSLLTPAPEQEVQDLVDHVRYPVLTGDMDTRAT